MVENSINNNGEDAVDSKQKINAYVVVTIGSGNRDAYISLYAPKNGGATLSYDDIMKALSEKGVSYGINEGVIRSIIKDQSDDNHIQVAFWTPPIDGIDGTIKYHFDKEHVLAPKEDDFGFVDYKNLGVIRNIKRGTPIATITEPTEGSPGVDIKGATVTQRVGKKANYSIGQNTMLNAPGTRIIAACDGHIRFTKGSFIIEDTVTIKGNVDSSVGNIDFIGDIVIKGEVLEGFKVSSSKTIRVDGNVTGAKIEAGGDVFIKKGCINGNIISHKDVTIGFCENTKIVCDGDLKAQTFLICDVYCGGNLTAAGGMGAIMGGKYVALKGITAQNIGTKHYNPTQITLGDNAMMSEERDNIQKEIAKINTRIITLNQIIEFIGEKKKRGTVPPEREEMLTTSLKEKLKLGRKKVNFEKRIAEINVYLQNKQDLVIICNKKLYPGVKVVINDSVYNVTNEWFKVKLEENDDEITPVGL